MNKLIFLVLIPLSLAAPHWNVTRPIFGLNHTVFNATSNSSNWNTTIVNATASFNASTWSHWNSTSSPIFWRHQNMTNGTSFWNATHTVPVVFNSTAFNASAFNLTFATAAPFHFNSSNWNRTFVNNTAAPFNSSVWSHWNTTSSPIFWHHQNFTNGRPNLHFPVHRVNMTNVTSVWNGSHLIPVANGSAFNLTFATAAPFHFNSSNWNTTLVNATASPAIWSHWNITSSPIFWRHQNMTNGTSVWKASTFNHTIVNATAASFNASAWFNFHFRPLSRSNVTANSTGHFNATAAPFWPRPSFNETEWPRAA